MQQVNLYTAQYPTQKKASISGKLSGFIIIVVVILIAATSTFYWKIEALRKEFATYEKTASLSQQALNEVKNELNKSASDDTLKIDLLTIKNKLKHKQTFKDHIDEESVDIDTSFYSRFQALSNQDIDGLWLIKIEFSNRGETTTLTGEAKNISLLTQYIQKLSNEEIFSGTTFKVLNVGTRKKTPQGSSVYFVISTDIVPEVSTLKSMLEDL